MTFSYGDLYASLVENTRWSSMDFYPKNLLFDNVKNRSIVAVVDNKGGWYMKNGLWRHDQRADIAVFVYIDFDPLLSESIITRCDHPELFAMLDSAIDMNRI